MKIFAIDDELPMLEELREAIIGAEPSAEVVGFKRAKPAVEEAREKGAPDVVFSDIELPGMDGLTFASLMREAAPSSKIVFVTAHPNYAVEAFRKHVDGFIVKPVDAARVREELDAILDKDGNREPGKLRVRCFGNFDVFSGDEPVVFSRTQTKELLAFLVDRCGGTCTASEIESALWERKSVKNPRSYLRVLTNDLRESLAALGLERVLVREHGQWAVRADLLDCDYYRMLAGEPEAIESYRGEYMSQYSWAEATAARLHSMQESKPSL